MATLIERLTDDERAAIRAALRAMTPAQRARLDGQCFSRRTSAAACYRNADRQCAVACAIGVPGLASRRDIARHIWGCAVEDVYRIANINDRGWLRTRAAVREILALAD